MKSTTKIFILALCLSAMNKVTWAQADRSFITHQSGDWSNGLTWEEYIPNFGYIWPASQIPNSSHGAIRINANHTVTISGGNVTVDQLTVDGRVNVNFGSTLTIAEGPGVDLVTNLSSATIWIDGTLVNNGSIQINLGTLKVGTIVNNGDIEIGGLFRFDQGTITGNDLRYGLTGSAVVTLPPGTTIDQNNRIWPAANGPANITVSGNTTLTGIRTISGSFTVGGTFNVAGALTMNGTTQVPGTLHVTGTVTNNGTTKVSGTLEVTGTLVNNGTMEILGTCKINPGGVIQGNPLVYTECCGSKLLFNTSYNVNSGNLFWPGVASPANVVVPAAFSVTLNVPRTIPANGSLQIQGTFTVTDTLTNNGTARIDGMMHVVNKFINNTTTEVYGTVQMPGVFVNTGTVRDYNMLHVAGTFINTGTTSVYQTLQILGTFINTGTAQIFNLLRVAGTLDNAGTLQIERIFQFDQGGTASGNDFLYGEYAQLVFNNSVGSYVVDEDVVFWPEVDRPTRVLVQGAGGITMSIARTVQEFETGAVITNADSLTITGSVTILAGGRFDVPPTYTGETTLVYSGNTLYNVGTEWRSGSSIGSGVPKNVMISEGATVNMPASARTCLGNMDIRGKLVLNKTPGANLYVGGNWESYFGEFVPNSRVVTFNGTVQQIIRALATFDSLVVNNPAGILIPGNQYEVIEPDSVTVTTALIFQAGNIRLDLGYLFLDGTVSGYSNTSHVVTYGEGRVVRSIAGGDSFLFPVAPTETSFNPLTIALAPTDTTETFSVRIDSTTHFFTSDDSLFVQRTWDVQEERRSGDNHAALTFQWAGAEEGAKFIRNASSTYFYNNEITRNSVASGTDPYIVSTAGTFPCIDFGQFLVGTAGAFTHEDAINGLVAVSDSPTPLDSVTTFSATVTQGSNVSFVWSFGDGESDSGEVVTHLYTAAGNYTVIVTASNTLGSVSDTTTVNVFIAPVAGLAASNNGPTRLGNATTLTATVTAGSRVKYVWNFGDGTPADSGAVVTHAYRTAGVYTAVVTASNTVSTLTDTTKVTVTGTVGVDGKIGTAIPTSYMLGQNYPNPFNPSTIIRYALPKDSYVQLKVYDLFGKEIATLVSQQQSAGEFAVQWHAVGVTSGVYFYRLQAGTFSASHKLILLR